MYKVSMDLVQITKNLKLKFGIVIKGDDPNQLPIMSTFETNGNSFLLLKPHPFITIDISNKKEKEWSTNQSFNISGMSKYLFTKRLRELHRNLREDKELFYTRNGKLCVDTERAKSHAKPIPVGGNKTVLFIPIVVEDEYTHDLFEGVSMMINTPDNYSNITFEEMEYLIDYLERIDMENLTVNFLNLVLVKSGQATTTKNLKSVYDGVAFTAKKINALEQDIHKDE